MCTPPGNIPSIIRNGSMKPNLHKLALSISRLELQNTIDLHVDWVPRSLNEHADAISRFIDCDDWGVSLHFFTYVDGIWGPHSVDRFANSHNFELTRFYCAIGTLVAKEQVPFATTGLGTIIGKYPQCP